MAAWNVKGFVDPSYRRTKTLISEIFRENTNHVVEMKAAEGCTTVSASAKTELMY